MLPTGLRRLPTRGTTIVLLPHPRPGQRKPKPTLCLTDGLPARADGALDTSFGVSGQDNTWSNASATTLNERIADGVIAVNVNPMPSNYQSQIDALAPDLSSTCR